MISKINLILSLGLVGMSLGPVDLTEIPETSSIARAESVKPQPDRGVIEEFDTEKELFTRYEGRLAIAGIRYQLLDSGHMIESIAPRTQSENFGETMLELVRAMKRKLPLSKALVVFMQEKYFKDIEMDQQSWQDELKDRHLINLILLHMLCGEYDRLQLFQESVTEESEEARLAAFEGSARKDTELYASDELQITSTSRFSLASRILGRRDRGPAYAALQALSRRSGKSLWLTDMEIKIVMKQGLEADWRAEAGYAWAVDWRAKGFDIEHGSPCMTLNLHGYNPKRFECWLRHLSRPTPSLDLGQNPSTPSA